MSTIYYLGPELTYSHEAAAAMRARVPAWAKADLVPCSTAAAIWERLLQEPGSGAIVPLYNREQGDVFDFSRFYLLDLVETLDLNVSFFLFSRADSLDGVATIYTKDTIVPQVNRWLATLPAHIKIVAQPDISSAEAARRAAVEPQAAAICSAAAGEALGLNRLAPADANRSDNFTRFGLFVRPVDWWSPPPDLFDRQEFPLGFGDETAVELAAGEARLCWTVSLSPHTAVHLGHLTTLLTLRKFALRGNRATVFWRPAVEEPSPEVVARFEEKVGQILDAPLLTGFQPLAGSEPAGWIIVAGLEGARALKTAGRRAILVDHVPGRDGYAKMSTGRANTIPWPIPVGRRDDPAVREILKNHFPAERLAAAGFSPRFFDLQPENKPDQPE